MEHKEAAECRATGREQGRKATVSVPNAARKCLTTEGCPVLSCPAPNAVHLWSENSIICVSSAAARYRTALIEEDLCLYTNINVINAAM